MSKLLRSIQTVMKLTSLDSFLQKVTFCGGVISLTLTAFTSPSFAQPNCGVTFPFVNVPLEKGVIEQFAQNNNYSTNQPTLGFLFENAALTSEAPNGIPFPGNNREIRIRGVGNAVPDIYLDTVVAITDFFGNVLYQPAPYADSFIGDAKAINANDLVTYDTQSKVYIAALAQSPAGVAPPLFLISPDGKRISVRPTLILFYPTTAFVGLSPTLVDNATAVRVATLQSISCQSVLTSGVNSLYIGESDTLNPEVFEPPKSGSSLSILP